MPSCPYAIKIFLSFTIVGVIIALFFDAVPIHLQQVFVLRHQLLIFSSGGSLPDQPPVNSPRSFLVHSRAKSAGLDVLVPKPGTEVNLGQTLCLTYFSSF